MHPDATGRGTEALTYGHDEKRPLKTFGLHIRCALLVGGPEGCLTMGQGGKGPAQKQCQALNRKGEPCGARPVVGSDFCHLHGSPEKAAELGRKGGRFFAQLKVLRKVAYTLDSPQAVAGCLGDVVNAVLSGRLDHRIGNTVAVLAGQLVRAQEAGELEKRLAALEEKLLGEKRP